MSIQQTHPWRRLRSYQLRLLTLLVTSPAGFLVALCVAATKMPDENIWFIAILGGLSGAVAGLLLCGLFGQPGRKGWLLAVGAALVSPSLGGAAVGSLMLPGGGTVLGAAMPLMVFTHPLPLSAWLACLVAVHLSVRYMRMNFVVDTEYAIKPEHFPERQLKAFD